MPVGERRHVPRGGIDPYAEYDLPGFPTFHRVEDRAEPIREVLA